MYLLNVLENCKEQLASWIYGVITFISKYLWGSHFGVAIFAYIIKILTMFIITIYKDSRKVKINRK